MNIKIPNIDIQDYDYSLAEDRIAKYPLPQRDESKLLVWTDGVIQDLSFSDIPDLVNNDALVVYNDTKVIYSRLFFKKETGSIIEIFCLEPHSPSEINSAFSACGRAEWKVMIGNNRRWKTGDLSKKEIIESREVELKVRKKERVGRDWIVEFEWNDDLSFAEILSNMGIIPLPPYLNREADQSDNTDYQTVYAESQGSVAAPTAGLHFTDSILSRLRSKGIGLSPITLHVGAGTFKPVSTDSIQEHGMHNEKILIGRNLVESLLVAKHILSVGTTTTRTLESLYWYGVEILEGRQKENEIKISQWQPYQNPCNYTRQESIKAILDYMDNAGLDHIYGETQLIIVPSYKFRMIDTLLTNFHQPKSTLLLLVSALIGKEWKKVYTHALDNEYRFLSYGDACLFRPGHIEKSK